MIRFNKPYYDKDFITNFKTINKNRLFAGNFNFTKKTINLVKKNYNFKNVYITNSCTSSFEIIADYFLSIKTNKNEILISSYEFSTIPSVFISRGYKVVFLDTNKNNPFISKKDFLKKVSNKTLAVIVTHHSGQHDDIDYYLDLAKNNKFFVIEDAAQSINLKYTNEKKFVGSKGDFACISFHETKNIHCGNGGLLIFKKKSLDNKIKQIWHRGTNRDDFDKKKVKTYKWTAISNVTMLSNFQCLMLYNQLVKVDKLLAQRKKIFELYKKKLTFCNKHFIPMDYLINSNNHMFYILLENKITRILLQKFLIKNQIEAVTHYQILNPKKFLNKKFFNFEKIKNAKKISENILRLPIYNEMKLQEAKKVIKVINYFFKTYNQNYPKKTRMLFN